MESGLHTEPVLCTKSAPTGCVTKGMRRWRPPRGARGLHGGSALPCASSSHPEDGPLQADYVPAAPQGAGQRWARAVTGRSRLGSPLPVRGEKLPGAQTKVGAGGKLKGPSAADSSSLTGRMLLSFQRNSATVGLQLSNDVKILRLPKRAALFTSGML